VLSAWENRCAITKTKVEAVLDAAHIFRYLGPKTNDVRNGMPLRTDIHRLFDLHLLTIVPNEGGARVSISKMLGTTIYRKLDQALVTFPRNASFAPDFRILEYHAQAFRLAEAARM
jgi:predicted restriction endonuclease